MIYIDPSTVDIAIDIADIAVRSNQSMNNGMNNQSYSMNNGRNHANSSHDNCNHDNDDSSCCFTPGENGKFIDKFCCKDIGKTFVEVLKDCGECISNCLDACCK